MKTAAKKRNSLASSVLASMVVLLSTLVFASAASASSESGSLLGIAPSIERTASMTTPTHHVVVSESRVEIFLCSAVKSIERSDGSPANATRYYDALEGVVLECLVAPSKPDLKKPGSRRNPDGTEKNSADQVDQIAEAQNRNRKEGGDAIHSKSKSEQNLKKKLDSFDPDDWE